MSRRSINQSQLYEDTNLQTGRSRHSRGSLTLTASILVDDEDGVQELRAINRARVKSTDPDSGEAVLDGDVQYSNIDPNYKGFNYNQKISAVKSMRGKSASSSPHLRVGNKSCRMTPTGKLTRIDRWLTGETESVEKPRQAVVKSRLERVLPKALGLSSCVEFEHRILDVSKPSLNCHGVSKIYDEDDTSRSFKDARLAQLFQAKKNKEKTLRVLEKTELAKRQEEEEAQRKRKEEALNKAREKAKQQKRKEMLRSGRERSELLTSQPTIMQEMQVVKSLPPIVPKMPPTPESLKKSFNYFAGKILSEKYFGESRAPPRQIPEEFYDGQEYIDCMMPLFQDETLYQVEQRLEPMMRELRDSDRRNNQDREPESKEKPPVEETANLESKFIRSRLALCRGDGPITMYNMTGMLAEEEDFELHTLVLISDVAEPDLKYINREPNGKHWVILGMIHEPDKKKGTKRLVISASFDPLLSKNSQRDLYIRRLEKMSSSLREFRAILNVETLQMVGGLLRPKDLASFTKYFDKEALLSAGQWLKSAGMQFNESQRWAIESVVSLNKGVRLLQGPPGTGKTHTLIGILSAVHHQMKSLPDTNDPHTQKKFLLVCAPSNAAVDEVVLRLSRGGLIGLNGESIKVKVVRLGLLDKNRHEEVKKCTVEELAKDELAKKCSQANPGETPQQALFRQQNVDVITKEIEGIEQRLVELKASGNEGGLTYRQMLARKQSLNAQIVERKFNGQEKGELLESCITRVLNEADVVCCTLNTAGSDKLDRYVDRVAAVIIDEACQATEPSALIPFRFQSPRVVLVGDPRQLAATIFSPHGKSTKYNRSLFERLADSKVPVEFLDTQYRMLPEISNFSSNQFYAGLLRDSEDRKARVFPESLVGIKHNNMMFIDLKYGKERRKGHSFCNDDESRFVVSFLDTISKCCPHMSMGRVGVVAPYKAQVVDLRYKLEAISPLIEVNTVDAFQGQEKDIIVFSCVRSRGENGQSGGGLGFLKDPRRLNVAITRAKYGLYVIGTSEVLKEDHIWNNLLFYFNRIEKCKVLSHFSAVKPFLEDFKGKKALVHDKISAYEPRKPENSLNYEAAIAEHQKLVEERKEAEREYLGKRGAGEEGSVEEGSKAEDSEASEDEVLHKHQDYLQQKIALGLLPTAEALSKSAAAKSKTAAEKRRGLKDLFPSAASGGAVAPVGQTSQAKPETKGVRVESSEFDLEREIGEYSKVHFPR